MSHVLTASTAQARAGTLMRQARVELFCDHPDSALAAIRKAVGELELPQEALDSEEIVALERAAWHVRRHDTRAAVAALDLAIERLNA